MTRIEIERGLDELESHAEILDDSRDTIGNERVRISGILMRAGRLHAAAQRLRAESAYEVQEAKDALRHAETMLYLRYREQLADTDAKTGRVKHPTEKTLDSEVEQDARWISKRDHLRDVELAALDVRELDDRARALLEALRVKAQMLGSLAADHRAEISSDPQLRREALEDREHRELTRELAR